MATTTFTLEITDEAFKTFHELQQNFNKLYDGCKTDGERDDLRHHLLTARDAYWRAEAENLKDDNEFVKGLLSDLRDTNKKIQGELLILDNTVNILKLSGEAIKLVAAITALAAV